MTDLNREAAELGDHGVAPNDNGVPEAPDEENDDSRGAESSQEPPAAVPEGDPAPVTPPPAAPAE